MNIMQVRSPVPAGQTSEYCGDQVRNVAIVFTILEIAFVALRYLSKVVGSKPFAVDDWLVIPALLLCIGLNATSLVSVYAGGSGYHLLYLLETAPHRFVPWAKVIFIVPIIYSAAVTVPKMIILALYSRIFVTPFYRISTYVLMALVITEGIVGMVTAGFLCRPMAYFWDKSIEGSCWNIPLFYRWCPVPMLITDVAILLLPLPVVWNMFGPTRNKIGLTATFMVGGVGVIASVLRTVTYWVHNPLDDATWDAVIFLVWGMIEPGCYLFASCLICFRPLISFVTGKLNHGKSALYGSSNSFKRVGSSTKAGSKSAHSNNASILLVSRGVNTFDEQTGTGKIEDEESLVHN